MNKDRWLDLMERLGFDQNLETFELLVAHYGEKHRKYHNEKHIEATLRHLDDAKSLANDFDAIELALWFHDAIYKVFSSENEQASAEWAIRFLSDNNASEGLSDKVHKLIMATLHDATPTDNDEQLMIDIDLSILGSDKDTYAMFEKWVRAEYKLVPKFIYRKKRREILQGFLSRERIFSHEYFHGKFESQARKNLMRVIEVI